MLELAIALTLYGDNFIRNVARASREVSTLKAVTSSLSGEDAFSTLAREVGKTAEESKKAEREFKSLSATIKKLLTLRTLTTFQKNLKT